MPGSDLNAEVDALRTRIEQAQGRKAKAEAVAAVAADRVRQATAAIREEFGIVPAEGPALLEKLRADLAAEAEQVRAALEKAGASE
jgi:predicted  nucleic acid-binding Zn-ribbon protein